MDFLDFYVKSMEIEMTDQHLKLLPPIMWSLVALDKYSKHAKFIEKSHKLIQDNGINKLSFSDCVMLN